MNRILLLTVALFACFSVQADLITQTEADDIVLERLIQETQPYIVYAKDGVQQKVTITSVNGEVFDVNYKFWLYYIRFADFGRYVFVKESNGNVLEVNVKGDATPGDLAQWRILYTNQSNCNRNVIISADEYENAFDLFFIEDMEITGNCLKITYIASICDSRIWNLVDREGVIKTLPCQRELRFSVARQADFECMAAMPVTRYMSFNIKDLQIPGYNKVILNISGKSIIYEYQSEEVTSLPIEEDIYSGTFTVEYFVDMREGWSSSGTVMLELKNGKYTYTSDIPPKLSSGSYSISNDKIIFDRDRGPEYPDLHIVPPYCDINLIPDGEYDYTFDGKRLKFSANKIYAGYYEYNLEKIGTGEEAIRHVETVLGGCNTDEGLRSGGDESREDGITLDVTKDSVRVFVGLNYICAAKFETKCIVHNGIIRMYVIDICEGAHECYARCPCYYTFDFQFERKGEKNYKYIVELISPLYGDRILSEGEIGN